MHCEPSAAPPWQTTEIETNWKNWQIQILKCYFRITLYRQENLSKSTTILLPWYSSDPDCRKGLQLLPWTTWPGRRWWWGRRWCCRAGTRSDQCSPAPQHQHCCCCCCCQCLKIFRFRQTLHESISHHQSCNSPELGQSYNSSHSQSTQFSSVHIET